MDGERQALRVVRGWLLAVSSAALTVSAHATADGGLPDPALTVAVSALLGWVGTSLAEVARGPLGLLATLSGAQLASHTVLDVLVHQHGGIAFDATAMTAAHACAVAVTAILVTHAERAVLALGAGLRRQIPVAWTPARVPHTPSWSVRDSATADVYVGVLLRHVCARRGPPRVA